MAEDDHEKQLKALEKLVSGSRATVPPKTLITLITFIFIPVFVQCFSVQEWDMKNKNEIKVGVEKKKKNCEVTISKKKKLNT